MLDELEPAIEFVEVFFKKIISDAIFPSPIIFGPRALTKGPIRSYVVQPFLA